ncbi:MAG: NAD-dependent epimerase/dehydratase family protein [Gemmataceae bacterium]|nr:NAD-dependent epimerase/dehydratase family protein [Gemmataceae bacterium]
MDKCLVTGGAGFIGSHLVDGLLAEGFAVRVLDDLSSGKLENLAHVKDRIEFQQGDIVSREDVRKAVEGCSFIFHLAALPSVTKSVEDPLLSHTICATGTLTVLEEARLAKVKRVVYASSCAVYGDQPGERRSETDPMMPLSPYAAAKLAGEHYCTSFTAVFGLETVRMRFFNVFGPRQDTKNPYSGVIALFSAAMAEGKIPKIFGDGQQARDFVYVGNVVQALILAARTPQANGRVYNVGMGESVTLLGLVDALNEVLRKSIRATHEPARTGDIKLSCSNIAQITKDLRYSPKIDFLQGLKRTLE